MKLFSCTNCGNVLYFENILCEKCSSDLGFAPSKLEVVALERDGDQLHMLDAPQKCDPRIPAVRYCANAAHGACNWLVLDTDSIDLCESCRHNGTVPDLSNETYLAQWQKVQRAKNRLFYSLLRLRLPIGGVNGHDGQPLLFEVLADSSEPDAPHVMTGHEDGLITLALSEADDAEREKRRTAMGEPYRTLLGHLRHEVGHYYWDLLVRDGGKLDECRALFGDDSADYAAALQNHYANGAPQDWMATHVSAYATSHAWEDFAETFAHYLHIIDTLEMATSFGVHVRPRVDSPDRIHLTTDLKTDPLMTDDFDDIMKSWLPISYMANNLNRCMGNPDLYPFTISPIVCQKLAFIHDLIGEHRESAYRTTSQAA